MDASGQFDHKRVQVTMDAKDRATLMYLKRLFGGSLKPFSSHSLVYNLTHDKGLIYFIHQINGLLRHSGRLKQFDILCQPYHITPLASKPLSPYSGYYAGFYDSNGTISIA